MSLFLLFVSIVAGGAVGFIFLLPFLDPPNTGDPMVSNTRPPPPLNCGSPPARNPTHPPRAPKEPAPCRNCGSSDTGLKSGVTVCAYCRTPYFSQETGDWVDFTTLGGSVRRVRLFAPTNSRGPG